jgi:hypothetical protein
MAIGGTGKALGDGVGLGTKPPVALIELEGDIAVIATTGEEIGFFAFADVTFDVTFWILGIGDLKALVTENANFLRLGLLESGF